MRTASEPTRRAGMRIASTEPLRRFRAVVGIERERRHGFRRARIAPAFFSVEIGGKCVSISPAVRYADGGVAFEAELNSAAEFELIVESPAGIDLANVDWCAPEVETVSGCLMRLGTREFGFGAGSLPVGFRFGGLDAAEFYRRYGIERRSEERGDHTLFSAVSGGADSGLRLTVTMKLFHELPVLEYRVAFENPAAYRSRRLSEVDSLQLSVDMPETLRLLRRHGSFQLPDGGFCGAFRDSFTPVEESLDGAEKAIRFGAVGGRPSVDWLPCFDLTDGVRNLRIAVGWSGQWSAELVPQPSAAVVELRAGIEEIDMVLEPGERIELPSVALVWNESGGTGTRRESLAPVPARKDSAAHRRENRGGAAQQLELGRHDRSGAPDPDCEYRGAENAVRAALDRCGLVRAARIVQSR